MIIKTGFSPLFSSLTNVSINPFSLSNNIQIGKVYGVITTENTPTKELFEANGGWNGIGTVFYLDYNESTKDVDTVDLSTCKVAKPFHSDNQNYPLIGELIQIIEGPSVNSQLSSAASRNYYIGTFNLWNNIQQNSPSGEKLGKTFIENLDVNNLIPFEGDRIYQGRKGNGIRFGSTVKRFSNINEWSSVGNDGDPIVMLVNGYVTTDKKSLKPNIEEINKELSSIYLTSTQKIPLQPGALIRNPIFSPVNISDYINSQIILNSDRVVINTKKDDIILTSKGFIDLNTDSILNLNSAGWIHLNIESTNKDSKILLGTQSDNSMPDNPVMLGRETTEILSDISVMLKNLAFYLSAAVSTAEGSAIPSINDAGEQLFNDVIRLQSKLEKFDHLSKKVFTI